MPRISMETGPLSKALPDHDGATFDALLDKVRLNKQLRRVFEVVRDGHWRTLRELEEITEDPQASISARLRDLRKTKFGGLTIERRRRGEATRGLFEYRLLRPTSDTGEDE